MRFPMINCLKYAQQCQNGIYKKMCQATMVPYSVMWNVEDLELPTIILCKHKRFLFTNLTDLISVLYCECLL